MTLIFGVSILFPKINMVQIILHFIGCLTATWTILDTYPYTFLWLQLILFSAVPLFLELYVLIIAQQTYKVINIMKDIQKRTAIESAAS